MKKITSIILYAVFVLAFYSASASSPKLNKMLEERISEGKEFNFYELTKEYDAYYQAQPKDKRAGWKQYERWKYFNENRINPDGTFPKQGIVQEEAKKVEKLFKTERFLSNEWELVGPNYEPVPNSVSTGVGRVNCVRFHPDNVNEIWIGAAAGGIWKSTNAGTNWTKVSPSNQFLTLGITDIAIAPSSPNVIYAATGDAFGARSIGYDTYSQGVIKSTDAGTTWSETGLKFELQTVSLVGRVLVHPENENIAIAATSSGIYKTVDGGASWQVKQASPYFIDMEFKVDDPNILIASTFTFGTGRGFIYRSEDLGETWSAVATIQGAKRIALATSTADPDFMYALSGYFTDDNFNSFEISTDAGATWQRLSDRKAGAVNAIGRDETYEADGQAWYDLCLAVSPTDPSFLYTGGIDIWKSNTAGTDFSPVTSNRARNNRPFVHADIHDLIFTPDGSKIYAGTDGGVAVSSDNGKTWQSLNDDLAITQYYKFAISGGQDEFIVGGTQDNGTSSVKDGNWKILFDGDGGDCYINPNDNRNVMGSYIYGRFYYSSNFGDDYALTIDAELRKESASWIAPLAYSETTPNIVYVGFTNVWKSTTSGASAWTKISTFGDNSNTPLVYIAVAPSNGNVIYAASSQIIRKTSDGGTTGWENMLPPGGFSARITGIAVDNKNPDRFWVSLGQFNSNMKVMEYDGEKWINRTGNLPNVPINSITYQKDSPDRIYIGTDIGVWYTDYNSGYWEPYGAGIPGTIVSDIEINYTTNKIYAGTHGRGIWKTDLLTCNIASPTIEVLGETEFCPGGAVTLKYSGANENFEWSTGENTREITVSESGFYFVTIDDGQGCSAKSTPIEVVVYDVDDIEINVSGVSALCEGQNSEVNLNASFGFDSYLWNTGDTGKQLTVTEPGEYWVKGTTKDGCESQSEVFNVLSVPLPEKPVINQYGRNLGVPDTYASYQWFRNGSQIFNQKSALLENISEDWLGSKFTVVVTDEYGCEVESDPYDMTTSINDFSFENSFKVTPNPSDGIFNINATIANSNPLDVIITNMLGEEVYTKRNVVQFGKIEMTIDLTSQPAGVYMLNINSEGTTWTTKIIKR